MNASSIRYAVREFNSLKEELKELIDTLGLPAVLCMVRQHHMDVERGWSFYDVQFVDGSVGIDAFPSGVLVGKLKEMRAEKEKTVTVILDPETVDSIEFEVYDPVED